MSHTAEYTEQLSDAEFLSSVNDNLGQGHYVV